ncbi:MAG: response regulator [Selenomonadaceae bacterium]|nr:response regulator [Selenomonadaceae bacterium]
MVRRVTSDGKNRLGGRPCAGCGKPIQSGLYCSDCLEKFRDQAKSQGKRIKMMKSNDLKKVAANRHETMILVVISDERNLNITKLILERSLPKYKIIATNNPLTAINTLTSRVINLIVLDADFNGLDMLRRIRRDDRFKEIPVLMMSGSTRRELLSEIFSLGVQDYIAKPCEPKDLVEHVNKIIGTKEEESFKEISENTLFNIMLIDDDIFDLRQERETIKNRFPCELTTAQSAVEGMKILENKGADLILVSLEMPFVDGIKFLSLLKENDRLRNIPVILMTTKQDAATIKEIEKTSAAGYIKKPVITEDGLATIEEKLRRG